MAKSSELFSKREKEKKRIQKRIEKEQRKEDRKAGKEPKSLDEMLAYVDENGDLTSTPPDLSKKKVIQETEIDLTSKNKRGASPPTTLQGKVKYFDTTKGFGFIIEDQTANEFFFHYKSANFAIGQSDRVNFETEMGPKGVQAVRITRVD